jgi:cytochrome c oxidase subunit 1
MFGRRMDEALGRWHFWLTTVPMMAIFLLMHLQGLGGMVRRTYDPSTYEYNAGINSALRFPITTLAYILFLGQMIFFWNVIRSLRRGEIAGENPWESATLEWTTPSPAPHGNFGEKLPVVGRGPYEYSIGEDQRGYLPQSAEPEAAGSGA